MSGGSIELGPKVEPDQWYPVTLGPTMTGNSGDRLYTMRYHFKPASVKSSTSGSLNISGDNEVTMEFHPPATGKSNFVFQGKAESCKELEAVLLFDGSSFTIEKLARSIGSLRHITQQSGVASSGVATSGAERQQGGVAVESERIDSPPLERDGDGGAKGDEEQGDRTEAGKKGGRQGGRAPGVHKHPSGRPTGKRKPGAADSAAPAPPKASKPKKAVEKIAEPPREEEQIVAVETEHIDEEEVVEEIIYEEEPEEARPAEPPRPKVSESARRTGLVESSSDSGHSSGSGSDDDSDEDDDDEDDDDDDGDADGSSGSDDDS